MINAFSDYKTFKKSFSYSRIINSSLHSLYTQKLQNCNCPYKKKSILTKNIYNFNIIIIFSYSSFLILSNEFFCSIKACLIIVLCRATY